MQELDTRLRNWSRHLVTTATINLSTVLESPYRREYWPERRKGISEFIHRLQAFPAEYSKHRSPRTSHTFSVVLIAPQCSRRSGYWKHGVEIQEELQDSKPKDEHELSPEPSLTFRLCTQSECVAPRLETSGMTPWPAKSNHVPILPSLIAFWLYSTVPVSVAVADLDDVMTGCPEDRRLICSIQRISRSPSAVCRGKHHAQSKVKRETA
jgi:hypothetical protein